MSTFEPSIYQRKILEEVKNENNNLLIDAKAGSGKTSTLLLISKEIINQNKQCLFLAFNKSIVTELEAKINNPKCQVKTIHALGLSFIRSALYRRHKEEYELKIDTNKSKSLIKQYFDEFCLEEFQKLYKYEDEKEFEKLKYIAIVEIEKLINFIKFYLINYRDEKEVSKFAAKHFEFFENPEEEGITEYIKVIQSTIEQNNYNFENPEQKENGKWNYIIDYTDMVYFPAIFKMPIPFSLKSFLDYILVDECQDLSLLQQRFVLLLKLNNNTRFIFVGDEKQAIYGFSGADTKSIFNLKNNFKLKELPLNICYRCPQKIIRLAKDLVPTIEHNKDREDKGNINLIKNNKIKDYLKDNDMIIGRKNSTLLKLYKNLVFNDRISVRFKNTDLVSKIVNQITLSIKDYIKRYNNYLNIDVQLANNVQLKEPFIREKYSSDIVEKKIIEYVNSEEKRLINEAKLINKTIIKSKHTIDYLQLCMVEFKEKGYYSLNTEDNLVEYFDIIFEYLEEYKNKKPINLSVKDFIAYVKDTLIINSDKNVPILSTIHMMKGAEADNVFIIDYPQFPYKFKNQTADDRQQELNLQYVALTRPKKNLFLCLLEESKADAIKNEKKDKNNNIEKNNNLKLYIAKIFKEENNNA